MYEGLQGGQVHHRHDQYIMEHYPAMGIVLQHVRRATKKTNRAEGAERAPLSVNNLHLGQKGQKACFGTSDVYLPANRLIVKSGPTNQPTSPGGNLSWGEPLLEGTSPGGNLSWGEPLLGGASPGANLLTLYQHFTNNLLAFH